ncbi:MAG TPA: 30S ribosomal protein S18 [Pyrinomonadaceae bacterium]|jgi:small subunit ribosomal protein S18|nr:30S ribosomal protein S18 [Pyrinomonadaceae bacterium]
MAEKEMETPMDNVMGVEEEFVDKMPRRYQRRRPRQVVPDYIDWKDVDYLRQFIPERGKIMPRRISGITAKDQRRLATAIKRARAMALLPFVSDN